MLWILFIAATLIWGVAYALGYATGQKNLVTRWKILAALAKDRRQRGSFWH